MKLATKQILFFTLVLSLIFNLESQAFSSRILQSEDPGTGDQTLPPNSLAPTDYYTVYYEFAPAGNITIAIQFNKPDQFFGLGLGTQMFGADIWAFQVINGKVEVHDYHGIGEQMPVLDTSSGGQDNLQVLGSKVTPTSTFIKFTRALDTGDINDKVIKSGPTDFIWSTANGSPTLTYHGPTKGTLNVVLVETPVSDPSDPSGGETEIGENEGEFGESEIGQLESEAELPTGELLNLEQEVMSVILP